MTSHRPEIHCAQLSLQSIVCACLSLHSMLSLCMSGCQALRMPLFRRNNKSMVVLCKHRHDSICCHESCCHAQESFVERVHVMLLTFFLGSVARDFGEQEPPIWKVGLRHAHAHACTHSLSLTHTHSLSLTHSITQSFTHSHSHSHSHTHTLFAWDASHPQCKTFTQQM